MEFFRKTTQFSFMAVRKYWYALSICLVLGSIAAIATRGLNLAIDFTGGVSAEATFPGTVDLDAVRRQLEAAGFSEPQVQNFGSARDIAIRLPPSTQSGDLIRAKILKAIQQVNPEAQLMSSEVVGPQIGAELQESALWALLFTLLLIFIYIGFIRFNTWKLSLGAILAVLHDPILVLGVFAITQTSFDLAAIAAILAVIGYSLNDTVVVFDRIRERFESNRRLEPQLILDQAINQTLSRTILTSLTTILVVIALLFLGGPVLRGFSEALLVGIVVGTYSSIYIASAVALDCKLTAEDIFPTVRKTEADSLP